MKYAVLQTLSRLADYREHFQRQEKDCFQKIADNDYTPRPSVRSVYWLQTGPIPNVGYTLRSRSSTQRSKFFYHADVFARTPPYGWITHKISFPGLYETPPQITISSDNQVFHVCRIWGEIQTPPLSCMPLRDRLPRQRPDPRVRGHYFIQLTDS